MNSETILVVDDEKECLNLLKNILEDAGYKNVRTLKNPHKEQLNIRTATFKRQQ